MNKLYYVVGNVRIYIGFLSFMAILRRKITMITTIDHITAKCIVVPLNIHHNFAFCKYVHLHITCVIAFLR